MNSPKISIIVPVYNTEKYLDKCISSLINQTLKEIEIICINDGSTDNSLKILEKFASKDKRIKIFSQENQGQSAARNFGIKHATGEYLGFVDADDWVDLKYFEELYSSAKKYDCDIACSGFKRCGRFRKSIRKSFSELNVYINTSEKAKADQLPNQNYVGNKIYRRENWLKAGLKFEEGRVFEDLAMVIKILDKLGNMVTVPDVYYYYLKNPNSTVTRKTKKHLDDYKWALNEMNTYAKENGIELAENKNYDKIVSINILGIKVLKIYYKDNVEKYILFGFIPIATKVSF